MGAERLKITKDTVIGDLLDSYPAAESVIEKHFGSGCFSCPGIKMESLDFGAMMHGLEVETILREVNDLLDEDEKS